MAKTVRCTRWRSCQEKRCPHREKHEPYPEGHIHGPCGEWILCGEKDTKVRCTRNGK